MGIDKRARLSIIWHDTTGTLGKSDCVKLTTGYTLCKAQVECIFKHDACERTVAKVHNRRLALQLGQKRAKKFAAAGSAGDAGLGAKIDINDLPIEAREPKLLVD